MITLFISLITKALLFLFFTWLFIPSYLPSHIDKLTKHLFLPKQQAVVLMYHHISNHPAGKIIITPELFGQHLNILQKEGYHVIPLEQYARFLEGKSVIPDKSAVITFDDGYESFYTYAYPQLLKKHMPATDFVVVGLVGNCNCQKSLPKLTWSQMKEMQSHNMSFYPHSFSSHFLAYTYPYGRKKPCLTGRMWLTSQKRWETESEYISRITNDFKKAKEIMEQNLGKPMLHYSWPYGKDSPLALKIARSVGFKYFYYVDNKSLHVYPQFFCASRFNAGDIHNTKQTFDKNMHHYILIQNLYYLKGRLLNI